MSECSLVRINRPAVMQLLRAEPDFAEMLVTQVVLQAQDGEDSLIDQLTHRSGWRLASVLLRLADDAGREKALISGGKA